LTDPLDLLQRLRVNVLTRRLSEDCARWLEHGIDAYLTGAGTLDHCLGLKALPGKRNHASALRLAERDELIRRLARGLSGGPWEQAGTLEKIISDFKPENPIRTMQGKYLAAAVRLKMDIPTSRRQLYRVLSGQRSD
jgi:hypothetical protein